MWANYKCTRVIIELTKLIMFSPQHSLVLQKCKQQLSPKGTGLWPLCPTRWTVRTGAIEVDCKDWGNRCSVWKLCCHCITSFTVKSHIMTVSEELMDFITGWKIWDLFGLLLLAYALQQLFVTHAAQWRQAMPSCHRPGKWCLVHRWVARIVGRTRRYGPRFVQGGRNRMRQSLEAPSHSW